MQIVITSKRPLLDDRHGRLVEGQNVDMAEHKAVFYLARGEAIRYETKVQQERPYQAAGVVIPSSVLPVARAFEETTLKQSDNGEPKKRGRPRKL